MATASAGPVTYEVEWIDGSGEDGAPEFCPECGRQFVFIVTWGDEA